MGTIILEIGWYANAYYSKIIALLHEPSRF